MVLDTYKVVFFLKKQPVLAKHVTEMVTENLQPCSHSLANTLFSTTVPLCIKSAP